MKKKTKKKSSKPEKLNTPDVRKILRVMKRYELNQSEVSRIVGVHVSTVHGWLYANKNSTGNIGKQYFDKLKKKGYV